MSSSLRGEFNQTQTIPSSILQTVRQQGHGASNTFKKSGNTVKLPPLSLLTSEAGTQVSSCNIIIVTEFIHLYLTGKRFTC